MVGVVLSDFVVLLILTIIHLLAIIYTWKVGRVFNSKSWNFIVIAFVLLLFSRALSFLNLFGIISYNGLLVLLDTVYIPIIFWIFVFIGMIRIYYKILSSIEIERRINRINKKRKRRR